MLLVFSHEVGPLTADRTARETTVFEQLLDSVAAYKSDGEIAYLNPVAAEFLGGEAGTLVGQNVWSTFPDVSGPFRDAFARVVATGQPEQFESYSTRTNRWYSIQIYSAQSQIWVIGRDVTDVKLATARLGILAEASRVFSEAGTDPARVFERIASHVATVLRDFCSIRLVSNDGTRFDAPVAAWDNEPHYRQLLAQLNSVASNEPISTEMLASMRPLVITGVDSKTMAARLAPPSHRDIAEELDIHSVIVAPLRTQGQVIGTIAVGRRRGGVAAPFEPVDVKLLEELADRAALVVTQWQAHRRVEEAHRRLSLIADTLPVMVSLIDEDQRYQFVNSTYEALLGRKSSDLIGRTVREIIGEAAYAKVDAHIRSALSGQTVTYEASLHDAKGVERQIRGTLTPYVLDGRIGGFVALVQDITERVQHEAELRAAIASRDEFLSIASHELRTPLSALELQLGSLLRSFRTGNLQPQEKVVYKVTAAARQVDRLSALVAGFFDASRMNDGPFRLETEQFDLAALVHEVIDRFEVEAERTGSRIDVHAPDNLVGQWDRTRLDQTLTNLLSNALKYGARRPVSVRVAAEGDAFVRIDVTDEGIGISEENLERIFDRFERAVSSAHYGGLGLGLYIARQIVMSHGGVISAKSAPGKGATFTVRLPRQPPDDKTLRTLQAAEIRS